MSVADDVRYVLRTWRRRPGVYATLVCTLAVGLGLGAAIFSFADGYLFRPLPFPSPDQLYSVRDPHTRIAILAADTDALRASIGELGFVEWSVGDRISGDQMILDGRQVRVRIFDVTPGFGQTLGIRLVAGRLFEAADHRPGATVPAWISYSFWQRTFGGDRAILNQSFRITGQASVEIAIAGILDPEVASFDLNNVPPDLIVPSLITTPSSIVFPNALSFPIVRLPGTMTRAEGEAKIGAALQAVAPAADGRPRAIQLRRLRDAQVAGGTPTARVLFVGALLVLLLVAINLAHLLLALGVARTDEISTRAALGAGRWRIARLFLIESLILGACGIGGGLLLGVWLSSVIATRIPQYPTAGRNLALVPMMFDGRVIVSAVVLGLVIALFGGLWPAWRAIRRPLHISMRRSAGIGSALPPHLSRVVLTSELAVATVLLLGAVFIGQGIWKYLHRPLGFSYEDRVDVIVDSVGPTGQLSSSEWGAVREAIASIAGVRSVGAYELTDGQPIVIRDQTVAKSLAYSVGGGYFEAWQARLTAGRWFSLDEMHTEAPVAIVDTEFAQRAWPGALAIGETLRVGSGPIRQVVGVVETRVRNLRGEMPSQAFIPRSSTAGEPRWVVWGPGLSSARLTSQLTPAVTALVPGSIVRAEPVTLTRLFLRQTGEADFQGPIMAAFGLMTFALAGIGVFGLVSYLAAQRTREFGIRLALGARSAHIWRAVLRESVGPTVAGLVIGHAAAWALERFVRANAFGWQSSSITTVTVVSISMLGVAIFAAAGPARRTLRIDPSITLRAE